MNWPLTESEETMVYFNKSIHWLWRAIILFGIYVLPQYVYILCHVKWFIHYVCILYGRTWTMSRPKMYWMQCWQEWVLHCKYNVLYLTDTCIFTTVLFILWKHLCCHAIQSNSICFRDVFSTVFSNGFDFPILLKNMCMSGKECYRIVHFCYIGMVVQRLYCSFRKLLQGICNLHLFLQIQIIQMSRKKVTILPVLSWDSNVWHCNKFRYNRYECTMSNCLNILFLIPGVLSHLNQMH